MSNVIIQNPVINSAFIEPNRHFRFDDDGITNEIVDGRRVSSYFVPIPASKKRKGAGQLTFDTEWTQDRIEDQPDPGAGEPVATGRLPGGDGDGSSAFGLYGVGMGE